MLDISGGVAGLALALFLSTALWHEFGHASALTRQGYSPGGIGAGLLFVIPVLFANVTPVGALRPSGRARVDVAGICFQVGLGGVMFGVGYLAGIFGGGSELMQNLTAPACRSAGILALAAVAWSLIPFIRSDGYWLICDLLGISDLGSPLAELHSWPVVIFLVAYRMANVVFLLVVGRMVFSRMLKLWEILVLWSGWPLQSSGMIQAGRLLLIGLMVLIGFGVLLRMKGLLWSSWLDLQRRK